MMVIAMIEGYGYTDKSKRDFQTAAQNVRAVIASREKQVEKSTIP